MMKSYSSYRNSNIEPIGHLPVEWRDSKIKYTGNVICGGTPSTANDSLWGGEIPWLQSGKVQFKPIYLSDVDRFITENGLANSSTKMVKGDSVLVAITGATCSNIGYLTFDSTVNQSIVGIEPSSKYSSWYIYYFLISQKHQILISQSGGAQGGVTKEEIKNLVIPKLPLREQEHIASFLNSKTYKIDKLTQLSEHKIELLKEQRTALINHCVTKGLNPNVEMKDSGITWIGDIPKHWVTTRIKYFLYEIIDTEHKTVPFYEDGKYSVVRTTNIKGGAIVTDGIKKTNYDGFVNWTRRGIPKPEDVLFTREAPVGECCVVPRNFDFCMGQRVVWLKVKPELLNATYLVHTIYSDHSVIFMKNISLGSTVSHLNMSEIGNIPIFICAIEEQSQIVEYLDVQTKKIDAIIQRETQRIELLKEYRQTIISDVVTGKIDVRDEVIA